MARAEMLMVFCYDVESDARRRRVARRLEDAMVRVQQSVFEAHMTEAEAEGLARLAERELGPGDSLRVYAVGADGLRRSRAYGGAPIAESPTYYLL